MVGLLATPTKLNASYIILLNDLEKEFSGGEEDEDENLGYVNC
jgi:hypothetical protein